MEKGGGESSRRGIGEDGDGGALERNTTFLWYLVLTHHPPQVKLNTLSGQLRSTGLLISRSHALRQVVVIFISCPYFDCGHLAFHYVIMSLGL